MNKPTKAIPKFANEDEERQFWATHDITDYVDTNQVIPAVFPNLKPTSQKISIRLPQSLLFRLKELANQKDIPYQSLMKSLLADAVSEEMRKR